MKSIAFEKPTGARKRFDVNDDNTMSLEAYRAALASCRASKLRIANISGNPDRIQVISGNVLVTEISR